MTLKDLNKKCRCLAKKMHQHTAPQHCAGKHGPLSETCRAGKVRICKITGDRKLCARMASLGVLEGEEAEIICQKNGSQCLLKIQGGTLSLDHITSSSIIVQSV
ncbi:MAG: ferrous iron transport protein A [Proteobacteria bacterium]|nr:ferrous iron transport protein A [Pseudomonadota bacterium]MBU1057084.1 ferrous iron transport protein A [Pseudomonadota bacterium]